MTTFTVAQGALSGGGFACRIAMSDDGTTIFINYDGNNCYIWNFGTNQWDNAFSQDRLPAAYQLWGSQNGVGITSGMNGWSAPFIAVAPSLATRLYAGVYQGDGFAGQFWRSNDRGQSWIDTGNRFPIGQSVEPGAGSRGLGPTMAVDPANPDVVYLSHQSGVIQVSTDGGSTFGPPSSSLYSLLINATATASTAPGGGTLTIGGGVPAAVQSSSGFPVYVSDVSRSDGITNKNNVLSTDATHVNLHFGITGATGVQNGDTLVFGMPACICFDRSSTVSGGKTQGIYIGWNYGASAVYHSTDGGTTWTATTGGPSKAFFMSCGDDGVLYACDHLTSDLSNLTNAWKYQSGTWTNFSIAGDGVSNTWTSCAADPLNNGHIAFVMESGKIQMSGDHGTTWYAGVPDPAPARIATDVPWLGPYDGTPVPPHGTKESMTNAGCLFDRNTSGKLWIVEGIGVWYGTPPITSGTPSPIPLTSQNKNQQSIILDQIVKPPGQPLVGSAQDRSAFYLPSRTVEPVGDAGIFEQLGSTLLNAWGIDYAKSDPTFLVCVVNTFIWKSTNSGKTWSQITAQSGGEDAQGDIACQTSNNFVWFSGTPAYTTDGGATWNNCLFAGSTLSAGWEIFFGNRRIVVADPTNSSAYYAYNFDPSHLGIWRSTDSGANWTKMNSVTTNFNNAGGDGAVLIAVPGQPGHLFFASGSANNGSFQLTRSVDSGATMQVVTNTNLCCLVAVGAAAPGSSYPTIFFVGNTSTDSDTGIFYATDFTSNTSVMPTWKKICRAPAGNMDTPNSLAGDLETFGTFYLAMGGTGYTYGSIPNTSIPSVPLPGTKHGNRGHIHFAGDWVMAR